MKQFFSAYEFMLMFVALGLTSISGYLSVTGIGMLFGINEWPIIIMAIFLELGKIMSASAAYKFDKGELSWWLKPALVFFTVVIMFISSLSIFGYLSSNYEDSRIALKQDTTQVSNIENQIENKNEEIEESSGLIQRFQNRERRLEDDIDEYETEREQLDSQIKQLDSDVSNGVPGSWNERKEKRTQKEKVREDLSRARSNLNQLRDEDAPDERNKRDELRAERDSLNSELNELRQSNTDVQSTLGPLLFVSRTIGIDTDDAVLYFIFIIIFVFDPMAVILVVVLTASRKQYEDAASNENEQKTEAKGQYQEKQNAASNENEQKTEAKGVEKEQPIVISDENQPSLYQDNDDRIKSGINITPNNDNKSNEGAKENNAISTGEPKEAPKESVETLSPIDTLFSNSNNNEEKAPNIVLMKQVGVNDDNKIVENNGIELTHRYRNNSSLNKLYTIRPDGRIESEYINQ